MEQRTIQQNKALYKYFGLVATALFEGGHSVQDVVEKIKKLEVEPTPEIVKNVIWRPVQKAKLGITSTTQLTTREVNEVYEPVSKWLYAWFRIDIPFPSKEDD